MAHLDQRRWTAGLILIVVGLGFFLLQRWQGVGSAGFMLVLGAAFLVAYLVRRVHGMMVPAGVLLGVGLGGVVDLGSFGDTTLLCLGAGFVSIYVVTMLVEGRSHWWPLVPGGILLVIGFGGMRKVAELFYAYWPLILVFVGVLILLGGLGRRERGSGSS